MIAALLLGGCACVLLLSLALTARRPAAPPLELTGYLAEWRELHGGYDPAGSLTANGWLHLTYRVARPLARLGLAPNVLSFLGLVLSGGVLVIAGEGGRWQLLGVVVVIVSGLADNLDGAVAVLTGRTSAFGAVLDSVVDRGSDSLYFLALWRLGAPSAVCIALGGLTFLQEYTRARAAAGGLDDIGVVTVWERPSRVILLAATLLGAGLLIHHQRAVATTGAAVGLGLAVLGFTTLVVVVRRRLAQ